MEDNMVQPSVWIMGGPGAGKGTQCMEIAKEYGYIHLSTGDLLRKEVLAGTERWLRLHELIIRGELAPDDEVIAFLKEAIEKNPEAKGFIIDGYPANLEQAKMCEDSLGKPKKIIVLDVPEDVMMKRLEDGENFNDQFVTIKARISSYKTNTKPVIETYGEAINVVKADRRPEEVFEDIKKVMES